MANVHEVAGFILQTGKASDNEGGYDLITNLKLQKLVYYCQGFNLAFFNTPLFPDPIEAWDHGPVCPNLYHKLKHYKSEPIPINGDSFTDKLTLQEQKLIIDVYGVYGQYSAWRLREMTHQEPPWLETPLNQIITHDKMRKFFLTQIEA
jgi:uncharacterized phage-associated protein